MGEAYWLGLVRSGMSRQQVHRLFQASDGALPPPTVTWATPSPIIYGTPLGAAQLNATASVAGTFDYFFPAGSIIGAGPSQILVVTFTPADTVDYPTPVTASTFIDVQKATPTIMWTSPGEHRPRHGARARPS